MTPEALSEVVERLLDDAVSPTERGDLAALIARDVDLHHRLASELALALQIRAVLADDAEQRADLLLATLSGSRRLALAQRIDQAIDATARRSSVRWLSWSGVAAAALLMLLVGGWWWPHTPARAPLRSVATSAPVPQKSSPSPVAVTLPLAAHTPAGVVAPAAPEPAPPGEVPDAPASEPAAAEVVVVDAVPTSVQPSEYAPSVGEAPTISATLANPVLAKPDPKALRLVHPLLINGSAQVRRQGREAASVADQRLVPGDEVRVSGDGADLTDERGMTWWCSPDTRLTLPLPRVVDVVRQPLHVTLGTVHVTAAMGLRPLITTPHLRIDAEEADVWLTVTTQGTRVETIAGSVHIAIASTSVVRPGTALTRPGTKTVRPLAPGFYALSHPGQALEIHPSGQNRFSVIGGRFARDGDLLIPRILRGVSATIAADLGGTALVAPLGDGAWLDQAAYRHLIALVELPPTTPAPRFFKHPALSAWIATNDTRAANAMRRADPLRPIHLAGPAPAKLPAWASSSELPSTGDAPAARATLAVVAVDDQVQSNSWDALIRGAQGLIWSVGEHDPAEALRPLIAALDATQGLLTDGSRVRLDLGGDIVAAQWNRPGRRLVVVVNRRGEPVTVEVPHTRGLEAFGADESYAVTTTGDLTTAMLPAGGVLIMQGALP